MTQWQHLASPELADLQFGTPGNIDILVGADVWGQVVEGDVNFGGLQEPHPQRTRFGWVVFGPASAEKISALPSLAFSAQLRGEDMQLEELERNFWQLEEVPSQDCGGDDERERHFSATHSRTSDGRYVFQIVFRAGAPPLGDSYAHALREYEDLGHMERVGPLDDKEPCYYIPHHAVTEKLRVVFNASVRTTNGISLNDIQLVEETIQEPLINIMFRFRRFRIALSADIEKMYRHVPVTPKHRNFQRIIWRESTSNGIAV
ncbi:uncharacterized protein LOC118751307 [Rhagoletis pomonella]|uniref:uncharacterized protein LOC118751307 n=1 Tax=Rhagoletis pomonella TaxID=28610 RepID=UPI0017826A1E|nr:uncharacterized protein LOC118751307 [Rhagoletis pomonella]